MSVCIRKVCSFQNSGEAAALNRTVRPLLPAKLRKRVSGTRQRSGVGEEWKNPLPDETTLCVLPPDKNLLGFVVWFQVTSMCLLFLGG